MGCCIQNNIEVKNFDLERIESQKSSSFVDVSLSSEEEVPIEKVNEWIKFKSSKSKSISDSLAMNSTFLQSERKFSVYSKSGSMADSLLVGFSIHK
jgi:hypothetical protein